MVINLYVLYCKLFQQEIDLKGFWICVFVINFSVAQVHKEEIKSQCTLTALRQYLVIQKFSAVHTLEVDGSHLYVYMYIYFCLCVYVYIYIFWLRWLIRMLSGSFSLVSTSGTATACILWVHSAGTLTVLSTFSGPQWQSQSLIYTTTATIT